MKKNLFYYLFAVICSVTLFTSCSDDDDEKMVNPVPQTTFLLVKMVCNLHTMVRRCRVRKLLLLPDATNAQKATLRLEGNLT